MAREKMWSRIHLIPVLQAEEDRDQVRRYYADLDREQKLLGSQSKAYNSDRYVRTDAIGFILDCTEEKELPWRGPRVEERRLRIKGLHRRLWRRYKTYGCAMLTRFF